MKEYQYSIIRREPRNPKRHRKGRGISQSDLEALKNELEGNNKDTDLIISDIRDSISDLDSLSVSIEDFATSAEDIKKRLAGAEGAISGKLDSSSFEGWKAGDLAKLLAGKQNKGNYVDPSQLATSAQQTLAEAVKQAEELDKQIKVGGRNLIRNGSEAKRQCGEWVTYRLYKPIEQSEPLTLSFDVIKVEKPPIGGRFLVFFFYYSNYRTSTSVKYEEGKKRYSVSVQALNYNYDLYGDKKDYDPDAVFIYPNSSYDSGGGCFTVSNVKLERGSIATDWTPAPEDVAESVTALASELVSSQKKTLAEAVKQAGALDDKQAEEYKKLLAGKLDSSTFDKFKVEDYKAATDRLTTAESAISDKLDSSSFNSWKAGDYSNRQTDIDKALASKQPAGSYALTSELATSQQQAVSEAVKQAGEMDKQIKVGGRNLIVTSRWKAGYLYGDRDENAYPVGSENYKVLVGYSNFRFDPIYIPTLGESKVTYKLYDNGGDTNGNVQIHAYDKDKKFLWWSYDSWDGTVGRTVTWTLPADTAYIRLGVTNENVRAKVEFGTVATDWTPAPEDVAESVTALASELVSSQKKTLAEAVKQAGALDDKQAEEYKKLLAGKLDSSTFDKFKVEDYKAATDRLTTAESAISDKLDSSSFNSWKAGDYSNRQTDIDKALASKQPAGSYALTSELATSQQQAVSEAVKQAGEMDKQIKVGGRNLIVTSRWKAGYLYGDRDENAYPVGSENYKVLVGYSNFRFDPIYIPTLGESKVTYKLYDNGGDTNGNVQIHAYDKDKKFLWWSYDSWDGTVGRTVTWTLPADTAYIRLGVTNENVRAKVEFGTVATDWTPAPEDVAESVTSLESKLLDPTTGEIHKLTTQLESHKKSTDDNFDDLATHPLTVDDNGYWRIWNLKQQQYVTTQYKSRGEDGQDAGRYLGRAKRIHLDFNGNYIIETENSWRTAKEGDYVYLVGDLSNRGGDKDTYYIVREHKSSTVWEEYDIKGRVPVLTLDRDFYLLADGERLSAVSLRPSPDEVVGTSRFKELLGSEVTQQVKPVKDDLVQTKEDLNQTTQWVQFNLSTAATVVTDLRNRSLTDSQRDEVAYLTSSLPQLRSADGKTLLQGLSLQRYITLSRDGDSISAYLASDALTAVLKAGITNFGKPEEKENVAINHNGTGHFGNLYFQGNQIDFRTSQSEAPYLSVGAEEADFIDNFLNSARVDNTPVSVSSTTLPDRNKLPDSSAYTLKRTFSVTNDGTRLTISIDSLKVETYKPHKAYIVLDGVVLDTWQGHISTGIVRLPDGTVEANTTPVPYTASNLVYERTVAKGTHMVQIILETPNSSDKVTLSGFKVRQRYDTGLQQSLLTKSGLRLYGAPDRYLDVDYRKQYFNTAPGTALAWVTNPYTLRVKGGAKVDKLTADELDAPGAPLCGATFNESGVCINSFGAKAKKQGYTYVQAYRAYNADFYRVYHSIGHTNYIPVLQVYGLYNNNHTQCLTTRIDAIEANSFAVRIVTSSSISVKHSFSYVAFKTTD